MAAIANDVELDIGRLEREHQELKRQVAQLDRRAFLTPGEQLRIAELKKRKLAIKDALTRAAGRTVH